MKTEQTLDPFGPEDWQALKTLGHQMIDDMMDRFAQLREGPAWQPVPSQAAHAIRTPLPLEPEGFESAYGSFKENVLPYPNGNLHPRFWGWVQGTGTPFAMLADMLASGLNPHMAGFSQAPAIVEETVMDWLKELMGFPKASSGLLTSGGTMANLIGLSVARHHQSGFDVRREGFQGDAPARMTVYASSETHKWAKSSMELLGFGSKFLRIIEVDAQYRIKPDRLLDAIRADRALGLAPICIIGNCGTVNTGAVDPLEELAAIAANEKLWFHIDGAFGALARLSGRHAGLVSGIERADSLAFDLHKWMYLPFEAGCVLVRKEEAQRRAFASDASYLEPTGRGVCAEPLAFSDLGIELTRGFKALKVWMSLKAHGTRKFGEIIGQNIEQCRYLASLIEASGSLKVMAPVSLNVVCFRYDNPSLDEKALDQINNEILLQLQEKGIAVPSGTRIDGKFALRVANVNHRSRRIDFETLVKQTEAIGHEIAGRTHGCRK